MVRIGSTIFGARDYSQPAPSSITHKRPKAVFFDQDGVLFNSMPYHAQAWEKAMREHGLPFTAIQAYRNEGRTGSAVIQELYQQAYGKDASEELIESIYACKSDNFIRLTGGKLPELIPYIREVLNYLHSQGIQCWVVTGSGQRSLIDSLRATFPGIFTGIISAFDVKHGKPHPEPYLKAWEKSGFRKEECCVIENAPLGIRAAKSAGIFTIAVNTGPLPDSDLTESGADLVLHDMKTLLDWFKNA